MDNMSLNSFKLSSLKRKNLIIDNLFDFNNNRLIIEILGITIIILSIIKLSSKPYTEGVKQGARIVYV